MCARSSGLRKGNAENTAAATATATATVAEREKEKVEGHVGRGLTREAEDASKTK